MDDGLIIVNTGDGKGKTTAAIGALIRSMGCGRRALLIQFIKSQSFTCGEIIFLKNVGLEIYHMGLGYTWEFDENAQKEAAAKAWLFSKEKILSGSYDIIVLDEINNIFSSNIDFSREIPILEVIETLKNRPKGLDVILTGRGAPEQLIDYADIVTEMKCVKHCYDSGILAKRGIEF